MFRAFIAAGAVALAGVAHAQTVLFSQPSYTGGIAAHFSVEGQLPKPWVPLGQFYMHANQMNPYSPTSTYLPVSWDVGSLTGLECSAPGADQQGIGVPAATPRGWTGLGHTAAQVCGNAVGAYLFSPDLFSGSPGQRMMISPLYQWQAPRVVFPDPNAVLSVALDLQIPTATSTVLAGVPPNTSNCYVKQDLLFIDTTSGGRMSLSVGLFGNGTTPQRDGAGFDSLTHTAIADGFAEPWSRIVTWVPGTATFRSAPWLGLQHFAFTVSQAQFAAAIALAQPQAQANGFTLSSDPTTYVLSSAHLNAELHYTSTMPATLGWSMSGLTITQAE